MERCVAITGLGAITAAGVGVSCLTDALRENKRPFTEEEAAPGQFRQVGRIGDLIPTSVRLQSSKASQIDTISRYVVEVAGQALKDTGLGLDENLREKAGLLVGTHYGCLESNILFDQYSISPDGKLVDASPLYFKSTVSNAAAGWASIMLKLRGTNLTFVSGRLASAEAIAHAMDLVADGVSPLLLAGGADRVLPITLLLDPLPEGVQADGAGMLALEDVEHATARGARVHALLVDYHRQGLEDADELPLIAGTLQALGLELSQVGAVVTGRALAPAIESLEAALSRLGPEAPAVWAAKPVVGEAFAGWAGLGLASACVRLAELPPSRPYALVCCTDPGAEGLCFVLRRP